MFEGRLGGRVYEIADDGTEADWARVVVWEPPHRVVLARQPNPTAPASTEVRFAAERAGVTRVELEHRGWGRLGELAERGRVDYDSGWPGVLNDFVRAAA